MPPAAAIRNTLLARGWWRARRVGGVRRGLDAARHVLDQGGHVLGDLYRVEARRRVAAHLHGGQPLGRHHVADPIVGLLADDDVGAHVAVKRFVSAQIKHAGQQAHSRLWFIPFTVKIASDNYWPAPLFDKSR